MSNPREMTAEELERAHRAAQNEWDPGVLTECLSLALGHIAALTARAEKAENLDAEPVYYTSPTKHGAGETVWGNLSPVQQKATTRGPDGRLYIGPEHVTGYPTREAGQSAAEHFAALLAYGSEFVPFRDVLLSAWREVQRETASARDAALEEALVATIHAEREGRSVMMAVRALKSRPAERMVPAEELRAVLDRRYKAARAKAEEAVGNEYGRERFRRGMAAGYENVASDFGLKVDE